VTALRVVGFGIFGLLFGSFLTVVVHRAPRRESVVTGRSRCQRCGTSISARDNIPLVSFLLLGGKCRHCGTRISPEYPLTELATAGLFVAAALGFHDVFVAGMMALFLGLLLALALTDLHDRIIPNAVVYPSLIVFGTALTVGAAFGRDVSLWGSGLGFLLYGGMLFVVALVVPHGMGMGDVKLAALIGLVLGSQGLSVVLVALAAGIFAGGLGAMAALAAGRSRKSAIPFGPYLAAGAVAASFAAPWVARTYTGFLH
jgi:leader peptidase (prepilin peptidase) / N-methyltransferase